MSSISVRYMTSCLNLATFTPYGLRCRAAQWKSFYYVLSFIGWRMEKAIELKKKCFDGADYTILFFRSIWVIFFVCMSCGSVYTAVANWRDKNIFYQYDRLYKLFFFLLFVLNALYMMSVILHIFVILFSWYGNIRLRIVGAGNGTGTRTRTQVQYVYTHIYCLRVENSIE